MSDHSCQTCKRLQKQESSVLWCIQCREGCCEQCATYHKAFKETENHKFLDLAEYNLISPLLVDINEACTEHGYHIEYFCQNHNMACCRLCKDTNHILCNKNVLELNSKAMHENQSINIDRIFRLIDIADKTCLGNINSLDKSQNEIVAKLKEQKKIVQDVMQKVDEMQRLFANQFQNQKEEIASFRQSLAEKRILLEGRRKFQPILDKMKSEGNYYVLSTRKLAKLNEKDFNDITRDAEKLTNIQCKSDIKLTIGEDKNPRLIADVAFNLNPCNILPDLDNPDFGSSTIEDEEILQQDKSENNDVQNNTNDSCNNIPEKDSSLTKIAQFRLMTTFKVERRTGKTNIRCANMLMNGDIIFGECSNPRLMIYRKQKDLSATRINELKISHGPKSIIVIDDTTIAYTALNYVGLVRINSGILSVVKRIETNKLDDKCFGLAFSNNKIIVNCEKSGIKVLSLKGEVMFANQNLTGIISICAGKNDDIFFVQKGQRKVFTTFTSDGTSINNVSFTEQCPEMVGATATTTDESGLIYVSCDTSNKIYVGERHTLLLPIKDISPAPLNIAYNAQYKELIVVNNDGKGISVYKKY